MNKTEQQLKRMAINGLNDIVKNVKKASKKYKEPRIPLELVNRIIDQGSIKKKSDNSAMEAWRKSYNKTLAQIKVIIRKSSDNVGDNKTTLTDLKLIINHVISNIG